MTEVQRRLIELLNENGMKPIDLAEKTEINRGTISQYLNGVYAPSRKNAWKISMAFNVNPLWVMGLDVEKHSNKMELTREEGTTNTFYKDKSGNNQPYNGFNDEEDSVKPIATEAELTERANALSGIIRDVMLLDTEGITAVAEIVHVIKDAPEKKQHLLMYLKMLTEMKNGN